MVSEYELALRDAANLACDKCAELAGQRLKSLKGGRLAFYPNVDMDECRFSVGVVDEYEYLVYQDTGFRTFTMTALKGKTVPMIINGQRIFRKVTRVNEFKPGRKNYWYRNTDGELFSQEQQARRWVHPGLPPKNFIRDGAAEAALERANDIFAAIVRDMEKDNG